VAYGLWQKRLNFDPAAPLWPNRDRFVLSAGHASMLLCAVVGMHTFGASAPLKGLLTKFGFTPEHVVNVARDRIAKHAGRGSE
jgi:transketolase